MELARVDEALDKLDKKSEPIKHLIQSIQTYQAELEFQNAELIEKGDENNSLREHYFSLFTNLPLPAITIDKRLNILESNLSAKSHFLLESVSEFTQKSLYRIFDFENVQRIIQGIIQSKIAKETKIDHLFLKKNDKTYVFNLFINYIKGTSTVSEKYMLVFEDISIEHAFIKQNALFSSVLDSASDALIALDNMANITTFSNNLQRLFKPRTPFTKQNLLAELPRKIADIIFNYAGNRASRKARVDKVVELSNDKMEMSQWFRINCFPINKDGEVIGAGFMISDESHYIKRERELELAIRVFNEGQQGIVVTDANYCILQANKAFEDIFGYAEEEIIGQSANLLKSDYHDVSFFERKWSDISQRGEWEGEIWNRHKDGSACAQWMSVSAHPKDSAIPSNYILVFRDISHQKMQEQQISELVYYDTLTGCGNRRLLEKTIESLTNGIHKEGFALFFIDLDYFKLINDVHGHDMGDKLLKAATSRLKRLIRERDEIFRLGGDEFLVLFNGLKEDDMEQKAMMILDAAKSPYNIEQKQLHISASIGISQYPKDGEDFITLLKHADAALYEAKESGRRGFRFFAPSIFSSMQRKVNLEQQLRSCMQRDEMSLVYMPILDCTNLTCEKAEVLLRWTSGELGHILPQEFIPVAEKSDLIHYITRFVLERTLEAIRHLNGISDRRLRLSINVSVLDLRNEAFFRTILKLLEQNCDISGQLIFELTENVFADDLERIKVNMNRLKAYGVSISIDDFGTSYSSLSYLTTLPIDELKIDREFTSNLFKNENNEKICKAVCVMAHSLNYSCVAEGVETEQQFDWLKEAGCDFSQGFLHRRPQTFDKFIENYATPTKS